MNENDAKSQKSILRSGLSLSFMTLLSRILGLVREMTKASFLGTSILADAFSVAFMIPNLFRRLFAEGSVSVAFIPTFRNYLEDIQHAGSEEHSTALEHDTHEFVNATFTLLMVLLSLFVAGAIALTPYFVPVIAGKDYDPAAIPEMNILTRIMFPYLFFVSLAAFYQGILNGVKVFAPSGFTPVLFNALVITGTYALSPYLANPARAMAIGTLAGGAVQAAFQLPFVMRKGWTPHLTSLKNAFTNPGTRQVLKLIGPTLIGMAAYQLNDTVSTSLATRAGTGMASSLQYSIRLQELILGIFAVSVGTVILPELSTHARNKDHEKFNSLLISAIRIIALIAIPVTFYSEVTGEHLIRLIYQNNRFADESVFLTLGAFRWHMAGLFFIALNRILAPAFYAQNNTKAPAIAGVICMITNMILAFILCMPMKQRGIALALSLASGVNTVVLFWFMKHGGMQGVGALVKETVIYSLKMIVYSLIAAVPTLLLQPWCVRIASGHSRFISQGIPVVLTAVVFAAVGVGCLVVTRDQVIRDIRKMLKK